MGTGSDFPVFSCFPFCMRGVHEPAKVHSQERAARFGASALNDRGRVGRLEQMIVRRASNVCSKRTFRFGGGGGGGIRTHGTR